MRTSYNFLVLLKLARKTFNKFIIRRNSYVCLYFGFHDESKILNLFKMLFSQTKDEKYKLFMTSKGFIVILTSNMRTTIIVLIKLCQICCTIGSHAATDNVMR